MQLSSSRDVCTYGGAFFSPTRVIMPGCLLWRHNKPACMHCCRGRSPPTRSTRVWYSPPSPGRDLPPRHDSHAHDRTPPPLRGRHISPERRHEPHNRQPGPASPRRPAWGLGRSPVRDWGTQAGSAGTPPAPAWGPRSGSSAARTPQQYVHVHSADEARMPARSRPMRRFTDQPGLPADASASIQVQRPAGQSRSSLPDSPPKSTRSLPLQQDSIQRQYCDTAADPSKPAQAQSRSSLPEDMEIEIHNAEQVAGAAQPAADEAVGDRPPAKRHTSSTAAWQGQLGKSNVVLCSLQTHDSPVGEPALPVHL